MLKQVQSPAATPEELLRYFDQELALRRMQREASKRPRGAFLAGAILFLVIGAMGALMLLFSMLRDMPQGGAPASDAEAPAEVQFLPVSAADRPIR